MFGAHMFRGAMSTQNMPLADFSRKNLSKVKIRQIEDDEDDEPDKEQQEELP